MSDDYRRAEARLMAHQIVDHQRVIDHHSLQIDALVDKMIEMAIQGRAESEISEYDLSSHECPTSPIELCVYHVAEDASYDDCIFCHQPKERK